MNLPSLKRTVPAFGPLEKRLCRGCGTGALLLSARPAWAAGASAPCSRAGGPGAVGPGTRVARCSGAATALPGPHAGEGAARPVPAGSAAPGRCSLRSVRGPFGRKEIPTWQIWGVRGSSPLLLPRPCPQHHPLPDTPKPLSTPAPPRAPAAGAAFSNEPSWMPCV